MTQIGQFTRTKSGYIGHVRTLTLDLKLAFVPLDDNDVDAAPDYRIHLGQDDGPPVGAGWTHTGEKAGTYISVLLDDPIFVQPTGSFFPGSSNTAGKCCRSTCRGR